MECSICNNSFINIKGLQKHRRNVHEIYCINKDRRKDEVKNCYTCQYCDKEYRLAQSRWQHEKKCKIEKEKQEEEKRSLELKNQQLEQDLKDYKDQVIKLQKKLLSSKRLDTKTFKAVNKILMDRSNYHSNNNNTNNTNNNNYTQILALGNEDLVNVLTMEQKKQIMNSRLGSLEKIVEITHCGELNQFKNIIVTNLKDNYAYRYDDKVGYFVTVPKTDLLEDVIMNRVMDIETIYDELQSANKIDSKTKKLIQDFLDKMANNDEPFFDNETKYDNFKTYKTNNIKILLYNNHDKITKDIALLIGDEVDTKDAPEPQNLLVG